MASLSWLWNNDLVSDVKLQLCTTQLAPAASDDQQPSSSDREEDLHTCAAPSRASETAGEDTQGGRDRSKVARRSGDGATAPEAASSAAASAAGAAAIARAAGASALAAAAAAAAGIAASSIAAAGGAARAGAAASGARTLRLHASVLMSSSGYFKTRLTQHIAGRGGGGVLRYADDCADAAAGQQLSGWQLTEHLEEGELDAMEAVLRHGYTGQLGVDREATMQLTVVKLMQMLVLSDRFDMPLCLAHCCEELAGCRAGDYTIPAINAVLSGREGGWHALLPFRLAVDEATTQLLQACGDAEALQTARHAVPYSDSWDAQLQQLSLPALLVLLSSDRLTARSENSVLLLAHQWMHGSGRRQCSDAEARRVAAELRLCQLSPAFLHDVLPHLPWIKMSGAERDSLLQYVAAGLAEGAPGTSHLQMALLGRGRLAGPPAWYSTASRAKPPHLSGAMEFTWALSGQTLRRLLQEVRDAGTWGYTSAPCVAFNGFTLSMGLFVPTAGDVSSCSRVWYSASVDVPGLPSQVIVVTLTCSVFLRATGQYHAGPQRVEAYESWKRVGAYDLPWSTALGVASWEPYLVDDILSVCFTVSSCE